MAEADRIPQLSSRPMRIAGSHRGGSGGGGALERPMRKADRSSHAVHALAGDMTWEILGFGGEDRVSGD